jgi:hypothetical protein
MRGKEISSSSQPALRPIFQLLAAWRGKIPTVVFGCENWGWTPVAQAATRRSCGNATLATDANRDGDLDNIASGPNTIDRVDYRGNIFSLCEANW